MMTFLSQSFIDSYKNVVPNFQFVDSSIELELMFSYKGSWNNVVKELVDIAFEGLNGFSRHIISKREQAYLAKRMFVDIFYLRFIPTNFIRLNPIQFDAEPMKTLQSAYLYSKFINLRSVVPECIMEYSTTNEYVLDRWYLRLKRLDRQFSHKMRTKPFRDFCIEEMCFFHSLHENIYI